MFLLQQFYSLNLWNTLFVWLAIINTIRFTYALILRETRETILNICIQILSVIILYMWYMCILYLQLKSGSVHVDKQRTYEWRRDINNKINMYPLFISRQPVCLRIISEFTLRIYTWQAVRLIVMSHRI